MKRTESPGPSTHWPAHNRFLLATGSTGIGDCGAFAALKPGAVFPKVSVIHQGEGFSPEFHTLVPEAHEASGILCIFFWGKGQ